MANPQQSHRTGPNGEEWNRKIVKKTWSFYPADLEMLEWIAARLGSTQSDAIRTAIRLCAAQLAQIPSQTGTTTP